MSGSDNRHHCGCDGSRKRPGPRRADRPALRRKEVIQIRTRAVRVQERISCDATLLEERTYNPGRGDRSSDTRDVALTLP